LEFGEWKEAVVKSGVGDLIKIQKCLIITGRSFLRRLLIESVDLSLKI
jgi:hypothetical protein